MNNTLLKEVVENFHHPMLVCSSHYKDRKFDLILKGKKKNWKTRFVFDGVFPFSMPRVLLLEEEHIGRIPHVNVEGVLCIDESDSIIVNYKIPEDLIGCTIESAIELLESGALKVNRMELIDEYEGFFEYISDHIPGNVIGADTPQKVYLKIWRSKNGRQSDGKPFFIQSDGLQLPDRYSNFSKTNSFQTIKSIYIPTDYSMLPPQGKKGLDAEYIYQLFSLAERHHSKTISKIIEKFSLSRQFYILFGLPRSKGTRSLVLFRLKNKKPLPHPFKKKSLEWEIKPYLINRHDKGYLLERGGADLKLSNKRVAIVGCGSVGSEIAVMLAKAGVAHLTLIDYDILEIDNIYRHRLGGAYLNYEPDSKTGKVLGWYKVKALSRYLEKELPHIDVEDVPKRVEDIVNEKELKNADVIISAVGSPSMNLFLNRKFKNLNFKKIIYCWNEAASAGGHALAVNLDSSCYECQFWEADIFSLVSPLNLVTPGQHLTKNLTGCAGVFTPFSYLDSSQTAMITARLCIEVIAGDAVNKVVSWKNTNVSGVQLTKRYYEMELLEEKTYKNSPNCEICGNG